MKFVKFSPTIKLPQNCFYGKDFVCISVIENFRRLVYNSGISGMNDQGE